MYVYLIEKDTPIVYCYDIEVHTKKVLMNSTKKMNYWDCRKEVKREPNEPVTYFTPLGWTCIGGYGGYLSTHFIKLVSSNKDREDINNTLRRLWEIEGDEDCREEI